MKVDGSYSSLLQGVSQQPPRTRLAGQHTQQINCSANPVKGLTRRAATNFVASLFTGTSPQFFNFKTNGITYLLSALNNDIKVFKLDGAAQTVNIVSGTGAYLDTNKLAFADIDNNVYMANRNKTVAMLADIPTYVTTGSLVYLLGGQYGRTYKITIDWSGTTITASYATPDGGSSTHSNQIATDYIATQLVTALNAASGFSANFSVTRVSDVLYIQKTSAPITQDFSITVEDGDGGSNMLVANNSVKDFDKVPRYAPQGYVLSVLGADGSTADDSYLQFQAYPDEVGAVPAVGAGFGREGRWVECVAPAIPYKLDLTTMPHILTYNKGTDDFTFDRGVWAGRQVGDQDSNADPSFVGKTIEDLGYFQGRLVALAGSAVVMSRTNKPLDFWRQSVVNLNDDDGIDIESTANGVEKLFRLVPHNRDLVVFADAAQFIVFGRNQLTPQNASLVLTTSFEADLTASPIAAGRNIFFAIKYGSFGGLREFYTDGSQDINDSRPITQHVSTYIQGGAKLMASSSNFDTLVVRGSDAKRLNVYEYIWLDGKKAQSAWSEWIMPYDVEYCFFVESRLYFVFKVGSAYHLEYMDLDVQHDTGLSYPVCLDSKRKATVTGNTLAVSSILPASELVFVYGANAPHPGLRIPVTGVAGSTVTFGTTLSSTDIIYGIPYDSTLKPTMPIVKDSEEVKIGTANLNISKFLVNYEDSGSMQSIKTSEYRDDTVVDYTTIRVGDPLFSLGEPPIRSGTWIVPFRDNADNAELTLTTNSHLPLTITSIEWMGQYTKKGKRITGGTR
jgi:hypothetical protein